MNDPKVNVCDVCGAESTNAARDIIEIENWATGWMEYETPDVVHFGCANHPTESKVVERRIKR